MQNSKKMFDFIESFGDTLVLFWDQEDGWDLITPGSRLLPQNADKIFDLQWLREIVIEDDKKLYDVFLNRIEMGMKEGQKVILPNENHIFIAVRLGNEETGYAYHNVECYLKKSEKNTITEMLVRVYELDEEEIYRIKLAEKISSDRNPAIFIARSKEMIMKHPNKQYAYIQFDVAKFKMINEEYGEERGDEVLDFFTDTLKILCNKDQLYSRLSADVFMVLTSYESVDDIYELIHRIDKALTGFKEMKYRLVYGVCFIENLSEGLRKYGDAAGMARESIKGNALKQVAFFENKMKESMFTKKFIEDNMQKALDNHEFVMYLQPKYSISKNRMVGAEALVRWIHPEKGMISPIDFIPLFEKNGFVVKMDWYIWEEACKMIRDWMNAGIEPIPISVNVSRRHLKDNHFVEILNELTQKYQIPKKYLEIEITETVEEAQINQGVENLKENGYTLLMDDFGSGYSSLNMLKNTKFDVIKIDREFLQNFIGSDRGQKIVEHTIGMVKDIGLDMVAEGVETKEQAVFLEDCGCDTAQGFYYAKPMKLEELNKIMKKQKDDI